MRLPLGFFDRKVEKVKKEGIKKGNQALRVEENYGDTRSYTEEKRICKDKLRVPPRPPW
jgi:hypothetical protein